MKRKIAGILFVLAFLCCGEAYAQSTCVVSGTLYDGSGTPKSGIKLTVTPLAVNGTLIWSGSFQTAGSASDGAISFTVLRSGYYNIKGNALGFTGNGLNATIPNTPTADLVSLVAAVSIPTSGVTVRDEGVAVTGLFTIFDFTGAGVTATSSVGGVITVNIPGGGSSESVMTTLGDTLFGGAAGAPTRLAGNTTTTRKFLRQVGDGAASAAPAWDTLLAADIPALAISGITGLQAALDAKLTQAAADLLYEPKNSNIQTHIASTSNPHSVTRSQVGLGNVANSLQLVAASNLSDLTDASAGRSNLGVAIGSQVQAFDSDLSAIAALSPSADDIMQFKAGAWANRTIAQLKSDLSLSGTNTGDQTITLTGDVTGSGTGSFATAIGNSKVTNAMLAGSIALSKLSITGTPDGTKFLRDDGSWAAAGSSGANTALSNLASVDINTSLLFQSSAGIGSATKPALESFIGSTTQYESLTQSAGLVTHAALGSATNIGFTFTPKGTGGFTLTTGQLIVPSGSMAAPAIGIGGAAKGIYNRFSNAISFSAGGTLVAEIAATGIDIEAGQTFGWGIGGPNPAIGRSAAGVVAITNGTAGQWGSLLVGTRDGGTTTVTNGLTVGHQSTGTPDVGLGSAILFNINSSTTADQNAAQVAAAWSVATHASRSSYLSLRVVENAGSLAEVGKFDKSSTSNDTGFWLWDANSGTVKRVVVGATDSGGSGFRLLRIVN